MKEVDNRAAFNSIFVSNEMTRKMFTSKEGQLTNRQFVLVCFLASLIEESDKELKEVKIPIPLYLDIVGRDNDEEERKTLKKSIESMKSKFFWIESKKDKEYEIYSWLEKAKIDFDSNSLTLKLHDSLKPFLIDLRNAMTIFMLGDFTKLRNKYSPDLYMLAASYKNLGHPVLVDMEYLKKRLGNGKYAETYDFKRRVLVPAAKEINEKTDINIDIREEKSGKKVTRYELCVKQKKGKELEKIRQWESEINNSRNNKKLSDSILSVLENIDPDKKAEELGFYSLSEFL